MKQDDILIALEYGDVGELLKLSDEELEKLLEGVDGELRDFVLDGGSRRVTLDVVPNLRGQIRPLEKR